MNNNFINGDMIRGHIDTIILLSLTNGDKHTNEIRDEIEAKAGGKYQVKQGTFYSALQRLAKQGFVSEYRSSTADSIRRKYFHLTEKGKNYVEKNIDNWNYSKSIIDDMISDEPPIEKEEKIIVTPTQNAESEFEELLKNSDNIEDFETSSENNELDDYFKQLNSTLQTELVEITNISTQEEYQEEIEEESTENKDFFDKLLETTDVRDTSFGSVEPKIEVVTEETSEIIENLLENNNVESTEIYDYTNEIEENISILEDETQPEEEILEDFNQENTIILDNTSVLVAENNETFSLEQELSNEEEIKEDEATEIVEILEEKLEETQENTQIDTSYATDDKYLFGKDENKELYSDLLDTLFASSNNKQEEVVVKKQETVKEDVISQENTIELDSFIPTDLEPIKEEPEEQEEIVVIDKITETKPAYSYSLTRENYNTSFKVDYSDIITYARKEGFKVRTSYTTNKAEIGKVLINKLGFHTSLIFLIFALIQLSVLFFVFKPSTILHFNFYILSALLCVCIVLVNAILFFINKGRTINKLSSFKNSLEIVFIICLNLILLISAYAIISDINFAKAEDLVRYIIIPILFVLNIPVFFIIKYLLLEKNTYYTK